MLPVAQIMQTDSGLHIVPLDVIPEVFAKHNHTNKGLIPKDCLFITTSMLKWEQWENKER